MRPSAIGSSVSNMRASQHCHIATLSTFQPVEICSVKKLVVCVLAKLHKELDAAIKFPQPRRLRCMSLEVLFWVACWLATCCVLNAVAAISWRQFIKATRSPCAQTVLRLYATCAFPFVWRAKGACYDNKAAWDPFWQEPICNRTRLERR